MFLYQELSTRHTFVKINWVLSFKQIDIRSCIVWTLFAIAILRVLWVFEFFPLLNILVYPGVVFGLFGVYYAIKNRRFLSYPSFLVVVLFMSITYHLFDFLAHRYLGLLRLNEPLVRGLISVVVSLVLSSLIYLILLPLKRRLSQ